MPLVGVGDNPMRWPFVTYIERFVTLATFIAPDPHENLLEHNSCDGFIELHAPARFRVTHARGMKLGRRGSSLVWYQLERTHRLK